MPFKEGETLRGWGVVRSAPWDFVGMFPTRHEAEVKAREMGKGYIARLGEHREGTDDFVWTNSDNPHAS
jgi:hypothetical protein